MKKSNASSSSQRLSLEDVKRLISRQLPDDMGILELVVIDEWLSQEMQSGPGNSKKAGDLEKLRAELANLLQNQKDQ